MLNFTLMEATKLRIELRIETRHRLVLARVDSHEDDAALLERLDVLGGDEDACAVARIPSDGKILGDFRDAAGIDPIDRADADLSAVDRRARFEGLESSSQFNTPQAEEASRVPLSASFTSRSTGPPFLPPQASAAEKIVCTFTEAKER
jgi:hypothetical protein